jgi:hypothetical protein
VGRAFQNGKLFGTVLTTQSGQVCFLIPLEYGRGFFDKIALPVYAVESYERFVVFHDPSCFIWA